jgi:hypothetical protein
MGADCTLSLLGFDFVLILFDFVLILFDLLLLQIIKSSKPICDPVVSDIIISHDITTPTVLSCLVIRF